MQLNENFIIAPIRSAKSGQTGPMGPAGPKGEPGAAGLPPDHQWVNTHIRFTKPDGRWGDYTNLVGPKGEPGLDGTQLEVQNETGTKLDVELLKYDTSDKRIIYDPAEKSLAISYASHSYQLDWTVNNASELPSGVEYTGAVVYVKNPAGFMWSDGSVWNVFGVDHFNAVELFALLENGRWGDAHLNPARDKVIFDMKDSFCGSYATLEALNADKSLKLVDGKSFAIITQLASTPIKLADTIYIYNKGWSPAIINGSFLYDNDGAVVPVTHIKAGENVRMDYNETKREITINSTGGGGGPADLSKYVKGENVQVPSSSPNDWLTVNWDDSQKTLDLSVPRPKFAKMNAVLVAGDNVTLEEDTATGLLKIGATFQQDLTPYVRGQGIDTTNGITSTWDATSTKLSLGYSPKFTDLSAILEAGTDIEIVQGTNEKAKINYTGGVVPPDLTAYAKKANIKVPDGYWGSVEVVGEDVNVKVKLTTDQIVGLFTSADLDITNDAVADKVKMSLKDVRSKVYSAMGKTTEGKAQILTAGKNITVTTDEANELITLESTAQEFLQASVKANLPLTSEWNDTDKSNTIKFDPQAFVNITDSAANVKVTYDNALNKLAFNVDQVAVPVVGIKKDTGPSESLGVLQINNAGGALVITDDPASGKKLATLTIPDVYQVTGHAATKNEKLTDLTVTADVDSQVRFVDGNMTLDLTKGYYVGKVDAESKLPTTAVADKSYGYVTSPNGYVRQYMFDGMSWNVFNPLAGMLFGANEVVTSIKNNNAVTFSNGELTVNQSGMMYKDGAMEKALHSIEVVGAGVSATYVEATNSLKLDIAGGGASVQSPLKVKVARADGSVVEYADTREITLSGDVGSITGDDAASGGKRLNLPVGIIVENNTNIGLLVAKYPPATNKGKLIFADSTDQHLRKWFGCDGENWFELIGRDFIDNANEIMTRFPQKVAKSTTASDAKDKTYWTYVEKGTPDAPEYTNSTGGKVRVDGFVMNMTYSETVAVQVFYPASDYNLPQYRNYNATTTKWNDWVEIPVAGGGSGDVPEHNAAEDAHEAIMLPAVVATMQTTWWKLKKPAITASRTGNLQLMLLSDSTGRSDVLNNPSASQFFSVTVPRTGRYKMKLMFQITGALTKHGDLKFSFLKNDTTQIHNATSPVSTAEEGFDAVYVNVPTMAYSKGDRISVIVSYSGDSSWSDRDQQLARIDAMKNFLVLEHENTNSGSMIADTFRNTLGGFCATPGYGACVAPDQLDPSHVSLVEVTGSEYNIAIVQA